jgi:hypothetical protein
MEDAAAPGEVQAIRFGTGLNLFAFLLSLFSASIPLPLP